MERTEQSILITTALESLSIKKVKCCMKTENSGFEQEDVEDWFTLWEDFRNSGAVVPPDIQAASSTTPEQSMIVAGQVAMQLIPSNQYGAFTNASQDEFVFHQSPVRRSWEKRRFHQTESIFGRLF